MTVTLYPGGENLRRSWPAFLPRGDYITSSYREGFACTLCKNNQVVHSDSLSVLGGTESPFLGMLSSIPLCSNLCRCKPVLTCRPLEPENQASYLTWRKGQVPDVNFSNRASWFRHSSYPQNTTAEYSRMKHSGAIRARPYRMRQIVHLSAMGWLGLQLHRTCRLHPKGVRAILL